jgi:SAM-dependent methyltransferase
MSKRSSALVDTRVIYCGDSLDQLSKLPDACIDLIYIDPPFNSNRNYEVFWGETKEKRAFEDRHASTQAYIDFMRPRCVELHRVLKKTGSFYFHCDWHACHYVKVMLDQIFGENQFVNDIVLDAFCGCGTALVAAETLDRQWIGIDLSPTACRVMANRLRKICRMREGEEYWRVGKGFVVRDLPWTEEKLRKLPPFEFENWAVIAIGGIPNKVQVGDMGIDGRIFPVHTLPEQPKKKGEHLGLEFMDDWYPIQVKQRDKAGRPDIDGFEAVMMRTDRPKGFFVSFDYSEDAKREVQRFFKQSGKVIVLLTVQEILEEQIAMKLA